MLALPWEFCSDKLRRNRFMFDRQVGTFFETWCIYQYPCRYDPDPMLFKTDADRCDWALHTIRFRSESSAKFRGETFADCGRLEAAIGRDRVGDGRLYEYSQNDNTKR